MKSILFKIFLLTLIFPCNVVLAQVDTMQFDTSAGHPGFTFSSWNWDTSGTIFMANLAIPSMIEKTSGTFDIVSFDVGPFVGAGGNSIRLTSDLGDTLIYTDGLVATHTLNWNGISQLTFERQAGMAASADHDNFILNSVITHSEPVINESAVYLVNYPQKATDVLDFSINNLQRGQLKIKIMDMNGKIVSDGLLSRNGDRSQFPISDIPNEKAYIWSIQMDDKLFSGVFIKNK